MRIFLLAFLFLQACDGITTRDLLQQSTSQMTLPLGPVHAPLRGTTTSVQASFAYARGSGKQVAIALDPSAPESRETSSARTGPSSLEIHSNEFSASAYLLAKTAKNFDFRFGFGGSKSSLGGAGWGEFGFGGGSIVSIEGFLAIGGTAVQSQTDWALQTIDNGDGPTRTTTEFQSLRSSPTAPFARIGIHLARRAGGPWIEGQTTYLSLFSSPRSGADWTGRLATAGIGWTFPSRYGSLIASLRATRTGSAWIPQANLQWTLELPIEP